MNVDVWQNYINILIDINIEYQLNYYININYITMFFPQKFIDTKFEKSCYSKTE